MRAGIRSRPWAGLDLGSYSIKLLASQSGVGGARYWLAEMALPAPDGMADSVHGSEVVAKAIADCMSKVELSPRSFRGITVGISGSDVILKQISLPLLADDEVGSALRFEARKHLPFDPSGMVIDFQILGRYPSEKRLDILLAAVSQENVDRSLAPLRMLGVDADIVEPTPLALTNALVQNIPLDREPYLLLDIGHLSSHLNVYQRSEPYFSRRLDFGGRSLTEAISKANRIPYEEAEEWKTAAGSDEPGFRVDWSSPEMSAVLECLRTDLVEELRRSFAFYRTVGSLPDPYQLWISGGTARLPGLSERLTEFLGCPVHVFDPIETLPRQPHTAARTGVAPQFAQVFGLSLRTA